MTPSFDVDLTAKQSAAIRSPATEILYGGAAAGGKSFFMRALAVILCGLIPGLNVYLFRRIREDLVKNHMEGPQGFPVMLASLIISGHVKVVEDEIRFWNGSRIFLCHCKDEKDRLKYLGAEIHVLLIDELTTFTELIYRFLRGRMRSPGVEIPKWASDFFREKFGVELAAKIPLLVASSNPGGIGHQWVKMGFIDGVEPFAIRQMPDDEGGMLRQYIPARLDDNPYVDAVDYSKKLAGLGSKALVKAYREGDWNIVAGAFFDNWRTDLHVIPRWMPPADWTRFRSMDWGSSKPFSIGWWVVVPDTQWLQFHDGTERKIPRGALIRYREWYGCRKNEHGQSIPNEGLKLRNEAIAKGIKSRERGETIDETMSRADPSIWKQEGGPSIYEQMVTITEAGQGNAGPRFVPADNSRVAGLAQMRARLDWEDTAEGVPMIYCTEDCVDSIRIIPAIQHDEHKPEDVDTDAEDHCFAADTLVDTFDGPRRIADLGAEVVLRAPNGGRLPGFNCRMTRRAAEVVRVTFEDDTEVVCTPDHRFESVEGWIDAIDLRDAIRYDGIWSKSSVSRAKSSSGCATTDADGTSSARAFDSIARSGWSCVGRFLTAITSTTSTAIRRITSLTIFSSSRRACTSSTTALNPARGLLGAFIWRALRLLLGMGRRTASSGTESTTRGTVLPPCIGAYLCFVPAAGSSSTDSMVGRTSAPTPASRRIGVPRDSTTSGAPAPSVVPSSRSADTPLPRLAPQNAGLSWRTLRVRSVEPAGRADVYCLTVPDGSAFMIEGGISVHNCVDDWRYACMSRQVSRVKQARQPTGPKPWTGEWLMQQT